MINEIIWRLMRQKLGKEKTLQGTKTAWEGLQKMRPCRLAV